MSYSSFQKPENPNLPCSEIVANQHQERMTEYYLIRHAEKNLNDEGRNPDLSQEGLQRTEEWIALFRGIKFDYIYSSGYKRTDQTAQPIATAKNLKIRKYDASRLFDEAFQKETKGKTVLVVGHSNTNPRFVNKILNDEKYEDLPESEYGSLFTVCIAPDGTKTSNILYIN